MTDTPASPAPLPAGRPAKIGPPTKQVLMGFGGFGAALVLCCLIGLLAGCGSGLSTPSSSPDLKTLGGCAKSHMSFQRQERFIHEDWAADRADRWFKEMEEELPWLADKSETEKEIKSEKKHIEAFKKNRSALKDFKVDTIEEKEADGTVKVKLTGKKLQQKGEDWEIGEDTEERTYQLTKIEGKWKIKGGGGR